MGKTLFKKCKFFITRFENWISKNETFLYKTCLQISIIDICHQVLNRTHFSLKSSTIRALSLHKAAMAIQLFKNEIQKNSTIASRKMKLFCTKLVYISRLLRCAIRFYTASYFAHLPCRIWPSVLPDLTHLDRRGNLCHSSSVRYGMNGAVSFRAASRQV